MGVTEAVGEEEERESWGEADPIVMREDEEAPSGAEISRFTSSLLLRDTEIDLEESMVGPLCSVEAGLPVEEVLIRCSAGTLISA